MKKDKKEVWKPIRNFPNYQVSNFGNVRSFLGSKIRILKPRSNKNTGYLEVVLRKNKKSFCKRIHCLVADSFIRKITNGYEVDHIDNNRLNNNSSNIRVVTHAKNMQKTSRNRVSKFIVDDMRKRFDLGESLLSVRNRYGVPHTTAWNIVHRKSWVK